MSGNSDPRREALQAFLQEQGPPTDDGRDGESIGTAVLTGVLVAEWMDTEGERWISRGWAASKAKWEADGMLHEALYGDWSP